MQNVVFSKDGRLYQLDDLYEMGVIDGGSVKPTPEPGQYNVIGGREYRTTVIGNLEWLAESLDYVWDGLPVGSDNNVHDEPWAAYYKDNKETYGKYGLMYNWYAAKYLDDHKDTLLPAGWRVPTHEDMLALDEIVGLDDLGHFAGYKLKSVDGWASGDDDGTDEFGMTLLPGGFGSPYPPETGLVEFRDEGGCIYIWQRDEKGKYAYILNLHRGVDETHEKTCYDYIRLVRDAT